MIDRVLLVIDPRSEEPKLRLRCPGVQSPGFAGGVARGFQQQVLPVAGAADTQVEAFVLLLEHQIVGAGGSDRVTPELVLTLGLFVFGGEEERGGIGGPGKRAHPRRAVRQGLAGFQIPDRQCVLPETGCIGGVGEPFAVGADAESAY